VFHGIHFDGIGWESWGRVWLEDVCDCSYGGIPIVWLMRKWGGWHGVLERSDECLGGFNCNFGSGWEWHFEFLWKEFDGVSDALSSSLVNEDTVAAVVFGRWPQVPTVDAMWIPCASLVGFFMYDYLGARWCQWCSIVIECAIEHLVCRHGWVPSGRS
jgi:hypothetical protein